MLAQLLAVVTLLGSGAVAQSDIPLSPAFNTKLAQYNYGNNSLYTYPTQFTQGIIPKGFHSHNDYWRPLPVYSALSAGATSIEADVWLFNGNLHIGHEQSALTDARTFDSLYIQPLLNILKGQNPDCKFVSNGPTKNGVYDTSNGQTLYLFVDVKTDGPSTWPVVVKALQPLRDAGYLSYYNGTAITPGPITVIGTGNTPLNQVQGVNNRDYFFDGPLATLGTTFTNITKEVSPIASVSFSSQFGQVRSGQFNDTQASLLKSQIDLAHSKGIKVRYWDQPGWPVGTRNAVWRILWDAGSDLLNVDDLEGVQDFWQSRG